MHGVPMLLQVKLSVRDRLSGSTNGKYGESAICFGRHCVKLDSSARVRPQTTYPPPLPISPHPSRSYRCSGGGRHHSDPAWRGQVHHHSGSVPGPWRLPEEEGGHLHQAAQPGPHIWHQGRGGRRRLQPGHSHGEAWMGCSEGAGEGCRVGGRGEELAGTK